ncbi:putative integral membrane protein [Labilithrix luteola]|uniref:Putative integral membrane protein n=1 Tax=Labilithrix luteola TaxID=1391654 RepID=A0A0K1QAE8_9BACT|nr:PrsW family intramembrane metalloprotease [Labilithrix luteola]AKV02756.1 putative integral membrane protein [Labilithrix luteola]
MVVGLILGVLCVTPIVLTYLFFIRWADRFEPEPWWLILSAFVWGAIFATLGGGISSSIAQNVTTSVFGVDDADVIGATIFAPVFEETFKGLGVLLIAVASALGLRELDGPLDGAIYGGVVGLGFTLTEDILYVGNQFATNGLGGFVFLLFLRTVLLGLSHCTFTACTGLGFGVATEAKSWVLKIGAPIVGFGGAIAMHAMHNLLPTFFGEGGLVLMLLVSWVIDFFFFVLLALLVVRDRTIVIRELFGEVGYLLHPRELQSVSSYFALGMRNWSVLLSHGWAAFHVRRKKQLQLVELAFIKSRRRRGEVGADLDRKEAMLRHEIMAANQRGVWIGS